MKFSGVLLCDDVRTEKNGKHIYIGVYGNDVVFNKSPASKQLYVVVRVETSKGNHEIEGRAFVDDIKHSEFMGMMTSDETGFGMLSVPIGFSNVKKSSTLSVQIREKGKRWKEVIKMPIIVQTT